MIHFLVTRAHDYTLSIYLETWGRSLRGKIRPIYYDELPYFKRLPAGTYIFSDLERLSPPQLKLAATAWRALKAAGCKLLNDPARVLRRYQLLLALHESGVNRFRAFKLPDLDREEPTYPVFIRRENEHDGSLTPLLHNRRELDQALAELRPRDNELDPLIAIEYCSTADDTGLFRKYSAFFLNGRIIPRHLLAGREWVLKTPDVVDEQIVREEEEYLRTNPHETALRQVAQISAVDFGRIDYSLLDGRVQVWEINTNPTIVVAPDKLALPRLAGQAAFAATLTAAIASLDDEQRSGDVAVPFDRDALAAVGVTALARWRRKAGKGFDRLVHTPLARLKRTIDPTP